MKPVICWTNNYKVYSFLCDNHGRLRVSSIAKFLQESAWEHAEHCGAGYKTLKPYGLVWILHGLRISIDKFPFWEDELSLETWGKHYESLFAYRDFEIFKTGSKIPLIQATSSWILVNADSHKPVRIADNLKKIPENQRSALYSKPGNINLPDALINHEVHEVVHSDIDIYNHVNNTSYIQFCLDAAYELHNVDSKINAFEIKFVQEAHLGDCLKISYVRVDNTFFFQAKNLQNNKEIFRAKAEIVVS